MQHNISLLPYVIASLCIVSYVACIGSDDNNYENYKTTVNTITRWRDALGEVQQNISYVDPLGRISKNMYNTCYNLVYPSYDNALKKLEGVNTLGKRDRDRMLHQVGYHALACFSQCPIILHGHDLYDLYYNSQCPNTRRKISAEQERKELLYIIGALRWALRDYVKELQLNYEYKEKFNENMARLPKQVYDQGVTLSQNIDKKLARYTPSVDLKQVPLQVRVMERELEESRYTYPKDPDIKNTITPNQLVDLVNPVNEHAHNNGYLSPVKRVPDVLVKATRRWYAY